MLKGKKGPYLLLAVLVISLFFILGVQYGKNVEKADKTIRYFLSITPTKKPMATEKSKTLYTSYISEPCGISLIRPSILQNKQESSTSAELISEDKQQFIKISCTSALLPTPTVKSTTISLDNVKGTAFQFDNEIEYRVKNPHTNKTIIIKVDNILAPLFVTTFRFTD